MCEVANPLMGWYYQHKFRDSYRTKFKPDKVTPKNCADLLARLVPHLPFYRLVSCPIRGNGGKLHFPSHGRRLPPLKIMHSIQKDMLSQLITKQPLIDLPSLYPDTLSIGQRMGSQIQASLRQSRSCILRRYGSVSRSSQPNMRCKSITYIAEFVGIVLLLYIQASFCACILSNKSERQGRQKVVGLHYPFSVMLRLA